MDDVCGLKCGDDAVKCGVRPAQVNGVRLELGDALAEMIAFPCRTR